jgi:RimJ/RimL family protein N-acetyltransferase
MTTLLETPRLVLGEMDEGDLDFVAAMLADTGVMRFYPRPLDREGSRLWLDRQRDRYAAFGYGLWLVREKSTGEPVGQVGLIPPRGLPGADDTELGWLIHRPFWRRGFAAEAATACVAHAFDALGCPRVIALVRPENLPSRGVASRVGLTVSPGLRVEIAGFEHMVFAAGAGWRRDG